MTTATAIGRLIHHSVIIALDILRYQLEEVTIEEILQYEATSEQS